MANSNFKRAHLLAFWTLLGIICICISSGCSDPVTDHESYAALIDEKGGRLYAHLDLKGTPITDRDLQNLVFPDTVHSISISHTGITDKGSNELSRCKNLERLDLTNTKITDATLEFLKELPNLRVAHVMNLQVSRDQFEQLQRVLRQGPEVPAVRLLSEISPHVLENPEPVFEGDPLAEEKKSPAVLLSEYAMQIQSLDGNLLIHLDLSDSGIDDDDLTDLPLTDSVRSISLCNTNISDAGVLELLRARNLHALDLRGTQISDAAADVFTRFPHMVEIQLSDTAMSQEKQKSLRQFFAQRATMQKIDRSRMPQSRNGEPAGIKSPKNFPDSR